MVAVKLEAMCDLGDGQGPHQLGIVGALEERGLPNPHEDESRSRAA